MTDKEFALLKEVNAAYMLLISRGNTPDLKTAKSLARQKLVDVIDSDERVATISVFRIAAGVTAAEERERSQGG